MSAETQRTILDEDKCSTLGSHVLAIEERLGHLFNAIERVEAAEASIVLHELGGVVQRAILGLTALADPHLTNADRSIPQGVQRAAARALADVLAGCDPQRSEEVLRIPHVAERLKEIEEFERCHTARARELVLAAWDRVNRVLNDVWLAKVAQEDDKHFAAERIQSVFRDDHRASEQSISGASKRERDAWFAMVREWSELPPLDGDSAQEWWKRAIKPSIEQRHFPESRDKGTFRAIEPRCKEAWLEFVKRGLQNCSGIIFCLR